MRFHFLNLFFCGWGVLAIGNGGISSVWAQTSLSGIEERIGEAFAQGKTPIFVFDLDETLIDSTPRKYWAFKQKTMEKCSLKEISKGVLKDPSFEQECQRALSIQLSDLYSLKNRYDLESLFDLSQLNPNWVKELLHQTFDLYLSGEGLELDREIPGAVSFVQKIRNLGARVYLISSRNQGSQRTGTLQNLASLGLVNLDQEGQDLDEEVVLKPEGMKSIEFKKMAFSRILKKEEEGFQVVGVFENEPENINAMIETFPQALAFLINGAWLIDEPISSDAQRVNDYYGL